MPSSLRRIAGAGNAPAGFDVGEVVAIDAPWLFGFSIQWGIGWIRPAASGIWSRSIRVSTLARGGGYFFPRDRVCKLVFPESMSELPRIRTGSKVIVKIHPVGDQHTVHAGVVIHSRRADRVADVRLQCGSQVEVPLLNIAHVRFGGR